MVSNVFFDGVRSALCLGRLACCLVVLFEHEHQCGFFLLLQAITCHVVGHFLMFLAASSQCAPVDVCPTCQRSTAFFVVPVFGSFVVKQVRNGVHQG